MDAWNRHDLEQVMVLFHEEASFTDWHGKIVHGKTRIHRLWQPWFANHGSFHFHLEDVLVDAGEEKAVLHWQLSWPSPDKETRGQPERRQGIDLLYFRDGLIIQKITFSQPPVVKW